MQVPSDGLFEAQGAPRPRPATQRARLSCFRTVLMARSCWRRPAAGGATWSTSAIASPDCILRPRTMSCRTAESVATHSRRCCLRCRSQRVEPTPSADPRQRPHHHRRARRHHSAPRAGNGCLDRSAAGGNRWHRSGWFRARWCAPEPVRRCDWSSPTTRRSSSPPSRCTCARCIRRLGQSFPGTKRRNDQLTHGRGTRTPRERFRRPRQSVAQHVFVRDAGPLPGP
jgi:hypothetical protein